VLQLQQLHAVSSSYMQLLLLLLLHWLWERMLYHAMQTAPLRWFSSGQLQGAVVLLLPHL
jgi:hypothetical protein